jgi:hypothetical protein
MLGSDLPPCVHRALTPSASYANLVPENFEHLLFLGVQTDKLSMHSASPRGRALMWSAGVTSSATVPTLSAFVARDFGVPWSGWFCGFALFWALGTLVSNWTSRTGDYSKARRSLSQS